MDHLHIGRIVEEQLKTKDVAVIYKHIEQVNTEAVFSDCKKYRYRLDISRKETIDGYTKTVCAIMQNPSIANENIADKSVQFLEKLIFTKDIEQFSCTQKLIIVNQFAFIQTKNFFGEDDRIGPKNDEHIKQAISESDIILIAWGSSNIYKTRIEKINKMLQATKAKTYLKGRSHPSRASYTDYVSPYVI